MNGAPSQQRTLRPPSAPPQTHHTDRLGLAGVPTGTMADRADRARRYLKTTDAWIASLHREGKSGLSICRLISEAKDRLLIGLWKELAGELDPPSGISLAALGGYGRRETAPYSDVDLLLLLGPSAKPEKVRGFAQSLHTLLWDLKLAVGWSVRTLPECERAAEEDHTVRTALLDCRFLAGDPSVCQALTDRVLRELLTHRADAFIADKSAELKARREKFGDSVYVLEPHVKQGKGGLRDLEAALWIAFARYRTRGLKELLQKSVLPGSEVQVLADARDFLLRIRNHLHLIRGRKEDRLTFDLQKDTAAFLGYQPAAEGQPAEQLMRHYYLSAKAIEKAADALIARCEEGRARRIWAFSKRRPPFKIFAGKVTLDGDAAILQERPELIVRLFRVADEEGLPIYSWARDQVSMGLGALEQGFEKPEVVEEVKALLGRPGTRGANLFEAHDLGVLGAALPEFGRLTGLHQHDLYHVYTVDVHTLFAVRRLYSLREGDLLESEPELSREMRELADPLPLVLGMLLHDCGKGMGGDHSQRGLELARQVVRRLGLTERQAEIVEFLVRDHLEMSRTSQRRDLSDPELIASFADRVKDVERLTCLYLLTYADMCSVGPTIWNEWKARLLKELFDKARAHLLNPSVDQRRRSEGARQRFIERCEGRFGRSFAELVGRSLPDRYFLRVPHKDATLHAGLLKRARRPTSGAPVLAAMLKHHRALGFSELTLCTADRPGLLSQVAGVLSAHGIDILRAEITSTDDGFALDVFDVKAPLGKPFLERPRWRAARADLLRVLAGQVSVEDLLAKRRPRPLWVRPLPMVETKISIDHSASSRFSVVDVRTINRTGLLHAIASSLWEAGVEISLAKISTEGHRVADSFYVTRGGRKIPEDESAELLEKVSARISSL